MKVNYKDAEHYAPQGGGNTSYFSLKNDKDTKKVRFLMRDMDEAPIHIVHEIPDGENTIYVECIRNYDDPIDKCPLCASKKYPVKTKLFLVLYDMQDNMMKIWERGQKFINKLESLCRRNNPLYDTPFDIERNGAAGSMDTTYEMYSYDKEPIDIKSLGGFPKPGRLRDWSKDEMQQYLDSGKMPSVKDSDKQPEGSEARRNAARRREEFD